MARCIAKVQQTPLGQQDDSAAGRHLDHVHLILDVRPLVVAQRRHLDFIVEVANVADDGHVLHLADMLQADDVLVAGSGDEDVGVMDDVFQHHHFKSVHGRLQRADRVDLGHLHAGTCPAQRGGRPLANIAIAADNGHLAGHHRIGRATDAVDQRFLAAVFVVELRFRYRIVHVDRRERKQTLLVQIIQAVNARGRFFGHAADRVALFGEPSGRGRKALSDLVEQAHLFIAGRNSDQIGFARLYPRPHQDVERGIPAIVQDHVAGAAFAAKLENAVGEIPIVFQRFALDRKYRNTGFGNGCCRMILGREDVARGPAHVGPQRSKGFNQNAGLDRHVQAAGNAGPLQRLGRAEFLTQGHQAWHFGFGNHQFLAPETRQRDVLYDEVFHPVTPDILHLHGS